MVLVQTSITDTGANDGASSRALCTAGTYHVESNVTSCIMCAVGSTTDTGASDGATACDVCAVGTYSADSTDASCGTCAVGSTTDTENRTGGSVCSLCIPDTYNIVSNVWCRMTFDTMFLHHLCRGLDNQYREQCRGDGV